MGTPLPTVAGTAATDDDGTRDRFVLSRPHGTVATTGARARFDDVDAAAAALRTSRTDLVVGALPFARHAPCALIAPAAVERTTGTWQPPHGLPPLPRFTVDGIRDGEHLDRVRTALDVLRDDTSVLDKVVLARTLTLTADAPAAPAAILAALVTGTPTGNGYLVDLSAAGDSHTGRTLVGSSPEVLVRKEGSTVSCHPLAGSAPRDPRTDRDREIGRALTASVKDRREHAFVVESVRASLAPFCRTLDIPDTPTLTHTPQLWHLGTPIRGELRDPGTTALDLALALHPTPAVCGTPTDLAYATIDELEGDRGFYAGAVGWCTADGDGEWMVTIRCAEISGDRRRVTAYAGGGIVAESDPRTELGETVTKFGTVLSALGVRL
ncbi:isochorismate synthase MenF [Prescottella sp. R16]|uniref:isochorismate synthase n=1 Tax=Prescottella sp. R16 TaxID=3064529 RepID=UPI00272E02AA|nr:isochorismate synthase [Prescottella sp. R16]